MLVISRKEGQRIVIGNGLVVSVLGVRGKSVRLGFVASNKVPIYREEIFQRMQGSESVEIECELEESPYIAEMA